MFTGIIEEIGTITQIRPGTNSAILTIQCKRVLENTKIGDSIAVNGICLTVTQIRSNSFTADVMHETLNRSSLAKLTYDTPVNLERALPANGRLGGHIVTGHSDGVGKITHIKRDENAIWYTVQPSPQMLQYIVEKGSIAIDGISLTVAKVTKTDFSISAIPHTVNQTILQWRQTGDLVNLETDILGKYVEKLLRPTAKTTEESTITTAFLSQYGF